MSEIWTQIKTSNTHPNDRDPLMHVIQTYNIPKHYSKTVNKDAIIFAVWPVYSTKLSTKSMPHTKRVNRSYQIVICLLSKWMNEWIVKYNSSNGPIDSWKFALRCIKKCKWQWHCAIKERTCTVCYWPECECWRYSGSTVSAFISASLLLTLQYIQA